MDCGIDTSYVGTWTLVDDVVVSWGVGDEIQAAHPNTSFKAASGPGMLKSDRSWKTFESNDGSWKAFED